MVPLLVLKFAVAGGGAYLYLRRYVKDQNYAVLGAVLYAFSGWGLYNIFFNHFIDVLALFPWMLWALDEAVYHGRHGLFAFWVGVNLLNNYFFFAGQVLFLLLYFICKVSAGDFEAHAPAVRPSGLRKPPRRGAGGRHPLARRPLAVAEPPHHRPLLRLGISDLRETPAVPCHPAELDPTARLALYDLHLV